MNGLGQLARVDETDKLTGNLGDTTAPVQPTSYTYDALGNLKQVTQGTQVRTFNYSSLSLLTSATSPESGTVSYTYEAGGKLRTKTDARGITITYDYDALARNKSVDYSNTQVNPDIERYYDNPAAGAFGRGRFWYDYKGGNYSVGSEVEHRAVDSYDALGRPLSQRQKFKTGGVWSVDYTAFRTYTRAGRVETQTLPSGHVVEHTYDAAGRLQSFTGNLGDGATRTYSSGILYEAGSKITREQFGTNTPLYHKRHYNTRGQLYDVRLSSAVDEWAWNRGALVAYYDNAYSWSNSGNAPTGADNNGNVRRAQSWVPGDEAVTTYALSDDYYDYDALNRLKSVNEYKEGTGAGRTFAFTQAYDYDRWGNQQISLATTDGLNEKQFDTRAMESMNRLHAPGDLD
jgi:YD repeat-containing protein